MKKFAMLASVLLFAGMVVGCSGTELLGEIGKEGGKVKFYSVKHGSFDGPNFNALVIEDTDGRVVVHQIYGGPGAGVAIASAAIEAVGNVGSSAVFGTSLKPAHTNVTDNSQIGNSNGGYGGDQTTTSKNLNANAAAAAASNTNTNSGTNTNTNKNKLVP